MKVKNRINNHPRSRSEPPQSKGPGRTTYNTARTMVLIILEHPYGPHSKGEWASDLTSDRPTHAPVSSLTHTTDVARRSCIIVVIVARQPVTHPCSLRQTETQTCDRGSGVGLCISSPSRGMRQAPFRAGCVANSVTATCLAVRCPVHFVVLLSNLEGQPVQPMRRVEEWPVLLAAL